MQYDYEINIHKMLERFDLKKNILEQKEAIRILVENDRMSKETGYDHLIEIIRKK